MIRIADDANFFDDDEDARLPEDWLFAQDDPECRSHNDDLDADSFVYSGTDYDPAVAIQIEHSRCYDPATGIRLSTDPIGYREANYYVYPSNDPLQVRDRKGL